MEEQILHDLGYKVWDIGRLTPLEKRRLVRGYALIKNGDQDTEEENRIKSEELIQKRRDHVARCQGNDFSR